MCGHGITVDHAMNCTSGGFPILSHNGLRYFTAVALSKVCHDVVIEPVLQLLSGESFHYVFHCLNVSVQGIIRGLSLT